MRREGCGTAATREGAGRVPARLALAVTLAAVAACAVKIEPPDRPIRLDIHIVIQQRVLIRVDQALDEVFEQHQDIFGLTEAPE